MFDHVRSRFFDARHGVVAALAITAAAAGLGIYAAEAHTAFSGANGLLVYQAAVNGPDDIQLFTVRPDGTDVKQITHFRDSIVGNANWSPDGTKIVFVRDWNVGAPSETIKLYTINSDGTGLRSVPHAGTLALAPAWLPDGKRIIFLEGRSDTVKVINAEGTHLRSAGIPGQSGGPFCASPDGKRIIFLRSKPHVEQPQALFVARLFGHGLKRITPWGSYADQIDCSPDGSRIVFSMPAFDNGKGKSSNVFTVKSDGTDLVQVTHETGGTIHDGADSWSPDGTKIAFVRNQTGPDFQIYTMNADGTGAVQLTTGPGAAHLASWGTHP